MRLAACVGMLLLVVSAGCLDGDSSAKARKARGELNEAPQAQSTLLAQEFEYTGTAESSFCLVTLPVCAPVAAGTNSPWPIEAEGQITKVAGKVEEVRAPGPYSDLGADIHVWLLDGEAVLGLVRAGSFEFEVPATSHTVSLKVTFENNPNNIGPVPHVYRQARDFHVEGTLWIR